MSTTQGKKLIYQGKSGMKVYKKQGTDARQDNKLKALSKVIKEQMNLNATIYNSAGVNIQPDFSPSNAKVNIISVTVPATGATENARLGNKITLKSLQIRAYFLADQKVAAFNEGYLRVIAYVDKANTFADLVFWEGNGTAMAPLMYVNHAARKRVKIVGSKLLKWDLQGNPVPATGGLKLLTVNMNIDLKNLPVYFDDGGVVINRNALKIAFIGDNSVQSASFAGHVITRVTYLP